MREVIIEPCSGSGGHLCCPDCKGTFMHYVSIPEGTDGVTRTGFWCEGCEANAGVGLPPVCDNCGAEHQIVMSKKVLCINSHKGNIEIYWEDTRWAWQSHHD